jgi:hypothetical protein
VEIIVYTIVGIGLYLICDRLLIAMEKIHGEPLPQRNIVFFVLILTLSMSTFGVLRLLFPSGQSAQDNYQEQQATD